VTRDHRGSSEISEVSQRQSALVAPEDWAPSGDPLRSYVAQGRSFKRSF